MGVRDAWAEHAGRVPQAERVAQAERAEDLLREILRSYRRTLQGDRRRLLERFQYVDAARKVVGVGSVGARAWVLLLGRDTGDPLILQAKEAQPPVLEPFLGKSPFASHGQRVVKGQRLLQAASDIMLGWIRVQAPDGVQRDFYVRQLWDGKGSAEVDVMEPEAMTAFGIIMLAVMGLIASQMLYKWKMSLPVVTLVAVGVTLVAMLLGPAGRATVEGMTSTFARSCT